jgi:hypothetical protein
VKSELEERRENIKQLKPTQLQDKMTKITINRQQNTVNNERLRLNTTKSKNEDLRRQINMLRKELTSSRNECQRYEKQIKKQRREAEKQNNDYYQNSKLAEETKNQIIALQAKHETEKERHDKNIEKLQERLKLKDKDDNVEHDEKKFDAKEQTENKGSIDFANPIVILKRRLNKINQTNMEKRRLMDQYLRNVKVIEDAFD